MRLRRFGNLVAAFAAATHTLVSVGAFQADVRTAAGLQLGSVKQGGLAANSRDSYWIDLGADEFVHIAVEQRGLDVEVELLDPGGTTLFVEDSPNGLFGPERIAFVARQAARYRVDIVSLPGSSPQRSGTYQLRVLAKRAASRVDTDHVAAEQAFAESEHRRNENTAASRAQALAGFASALGSFESLDLRYEAALTLYCMGVTHLRSGETHEAIAPLSRSVEIFRTLDGPMYASAVNALGGAYDLTGDVALARSKYTEAFEYFHAHNSGDSEGVAHNNIGKLYSDAGDWQRALEEYRLALPLFRAAGDRNREGLALYQIGMAYSGLGDKDRAVQYLQQALTVRREANDKSGQADALTSLGNIESGGGDTQKGIRHLQEALLLREVVGDKRAEGMTLSFLGTAQVAIGDTSAALASLAKSIEFRRAGGDRRGEALSKLNLSVAQNASGQYDAALATASDGLTVLRDLGDRNNAARALLQMARAERALGRVDEALQHSDQAIKDVEEVRGRASTPEFRASYLGQRHDIYEVQIDLLARLAGRDATYSAQALQVSEQAHARSLLDLLSESESNIRSGVAPALIEQERSLAQALDAKAQRSLLLATRANQGVEQTRLSGEIGELEAQYNEVLAAIRKASPAYAALTQPQPLDVRAIQHDVLDADTSLIEYSLGDEASYAWVVDQQNLHSVRLPPRKEIEAVARKAYELVTARGSSVKGETMLQGQQRIAAADKDLSAALGQLSDLVLKPLVAFAKTPRMLIVADGALQYIPFGMLPVTAADGTAKPLISDFEVVAMPSASAIAIQRAQLKGRPRAPNGVAVIADPVFDSTDARMTARTAAVRNLAADSDGSTRILEHLQLPSTSSSLSIPRLPYTRDEANAILATASGRKNLSALGFDATKDKVTGNALSSYRIVHFATHGFLDSERPSLSAVVLSLVDRNGKARDGILRAHELYNLNLPADLVVLSACQTGLGKDIRGEGLVGLTQGLMYAGAARVIVSLWSVSDKATASLMGDLYREMLTKGQSPAAALRSAQLAVMQQKGWENPYYWAAFTVQGDWQSR